MNMIREKILKSKLDQIKILLINDLLLLMTVGS